MIRRSVTAGLIAAGVFTVYSAAAMGLGGRGWWLPLNAVAHSLWRGSPLDGQFHPLAALLALAVLVVAAVAAMVAFAALAAGAAFGPIALLVGAGVYGNVLWTVGHYFVWPELDPVGAVAFSPGVAWVAHIFAGLAGAAWLIWAPTGARPREDSHAH